MLSCENNNIALNVWSTKVSVCLAQSLCTVDGQGQTSVNALTVFITSVWRCCTLTGRQETCAPVAS